MPIHDDHDTPQTRQTTSTSGDGTPAAPEWNGLRWCRALRRSHVKPGAKLIGELLEEASDWSTGRNAAVGRARLVRQSKLSERSVGTHRQELIDAGWIVQTRPATATTPPVYRLSLGLIDTADLDEVDPDGSLRAYLGSTGAPEKGRGPADEDETPEKETPPDPLPPATVEGVQDLHPSPLDDQGGVQDLPPGGAGFAPGGVQDLHQGGCKICTQPLLSSSSSSSLSCSCGPDDTDGRGPGNEREKNLDTKSDDRHQGDPVVVVLSRFQALTGRTGSGIEDRARAAWARVVTGRGIDPAAVLALLDDDDHGMTADVWPDAWIEAAGPVVVREAERAARRAARPKGDPTCPTCRGRGTTDKRNARGGWDTVRCECVGLRSVPGDETVARPDLDTAAADAARDDRRPAPAGWRDRGRGGAVDFSLLTRRVESA